MRSAMRAASQLHGRGPLVWMMPLHLRVNQKSEYEDDDDYAICKHQTQKKVIPHGC